VEYHYFDEALDPSAEPISAVNWTEGPVLDRSFGPTEAYEVGRALTEAWSLHASALATQNTAYLADRFSGGALSRATASAADPSVRMVVLHQQATPLVFHRDGSVLQVADTALTARFLLKDGALQAFRLTNDANITTLLNEPSGWHIISHERQGATPVRADQAVYRPKAPLAGINYYPAASSWHQFWPGFDIAVIRRDMGLIRGLGANSVRIFLQRDALLDPDTAPDALNNLALLLQAAQAQGLQVVPTLFDLRGGYEPGLWADDYAELRAILPVLAAAPNVAFVDLKNEADLDYPLYGKGTVQAWLLAMTASARSIAPGLPLTVGWSSAQAAAEMTGPFDLITYHDYPDVTRAAERLASLRRAAGDKPVIVTEIGATSWNALAGFPASPSSQAEAIAARGAALRGADGIFLWTLHDFTAPDTSVTGRAPWNKARQSHYGLIDSAGHEKPAATAARNLFSQVTEGTPS
jgi:hypothetical protein